MAKTLRQQLLEGLQATADVSQDAFLMIRHEHLKEVMDFIETTPAAEYAQAKLSKLFESQNWALDSQLKEAFFQLTGEVEFWMMAERRGVPLERIPENADKNPDFQANGAFPNPLRFEVKTLSVAGGWRSLESFQEDGFEVSLELASQRAAGVQIATSARAIAPHGYAPRGKQRTAMCRNLIQKSSNNIKIGQYISGPTFLVLNLTLIDGHETGNSYLRPVSFGFPRDTDVQTGVLWTIAFGDIGQLIHVAPEFEGLAAIEGQLERQGILVNPDYVGIEGLLLIVHNLSKPPTMYGLWREASNRKWQEQAPEISQALSKLVGGNWNDEQDSNGWRLKEHR